MATTISVTPREINAALAEGEGYKALDALLKPFTNDGRNVRGLRRAALKHRSYVQSVDQVKRIVLLDTPFLVADAKPAAKPRSKNTAKK